MKTLLQFYLIHQKKKILGFFSATMPQEVARIAKEFMKRPQEITVGQKNQGSTTVSHEYYLVGARDRYPALKRLADINPNIFSVIFCRTKRDTQAVAEKLIEDGYNAAALHGDLSQAQRDGVMKAFRGRQIQMLVATDVAARGIDVDDITHVINYQLPDEVETYNHRSGRTGRAGKLGTSIVIVTKSEYKKISQIERIIKTKFVHKPIPTGMEICQAQLIHLANKVKSVEVDAEIETYLPQIEELLGDLTKEELIKKMFSVEFNRFIEYYKKQNTIDSPRPRENSEGGTAVSSDGSVRYFLNLGARDNFDWMSLKDFLRDTLDLGRDDLFKVDVKEGFSFFNTDAAHSERIIEILNNMHHEGRQVNVEISTSGGGSSSRRDHNGRGGRSSGGFRGERSGGFRGERSGGFRGERSSSDRRPAGGDRFGDRKTESKFGRNREDDRPAHNERRSVRGDRPRRSN